MFHDTDEDWIRSFPVDIREDDDAFHVDADLPGFNRDQIDVTLQENVLTITANAENEDEDRYYVQQERATGTRRRMFRLTQAVDDQQIDAKLENGVLHLVLPKRSEVKPRRIELKN
ncbi:MAG: Hsp20/alpha crystallin family protein [Planctomycetota bacterium]